MPFLISAVQISANICSTDICKAEKVVFPCVSSTNAMRRWKWLNCSSLSNWGVPFKCTLIWWYLREGNLERNELWRRKIDAAFVSEKWYEKKTSICCCYANEKWKWFENKSNAAPVLDMMKMISESDIMKQTILLCD